MTEINDDRPMGTTEAAQYIGKSVQTLAQWRYAGIGPQFVKIGRRTVLYRRRDIDEWLEANLRTQTGAE